jgi:hypothetical protein
MGLTISRQTDRRHAARRPVGARPGLPTLALRTGATVEVVDMSVGGVLVESSVCLAPGTTVAIRAFSTPQGVVNRAMVIHCRVSSLDRRFGIRYRAGLCFESCSDYPSDPPPRALGNALPTHPLRQRTSWVARGPFGRVPRAGAQIV